MKKNVIDICLWDGAEAAELYFDGYMARIMPELGGNIVKLSYNGEDILKTPKDLEGYKKSQNNFGIPHLFPPNRIKGGRFSFDGREYTFPVKSSGNSLHGFLHLSSWEVESKKTEKNYVSLKLFYISSESSEHFTYFPHTFKCVREYILSKDGLEERYSVENLGRETMPLSLGYHTAFPVDPIKNVKIRVSLGDSIVLGEGKIPTGEGVPLEGKEEDIRTRGIDPNYKALDNLYRAEKFEREGLVHGAVIGGIHSAGDVVYQVDEKYKYWVLCNYNRRGDIICIEPQTSAIDAQNQKWGDLVSLKSEEIWSSRNKLFVRAGVELAE